MKRLCIMLTATVLVSSLYAPGSAGQEAERPAFVLDESAWVTFYDLPSRRFRAIRDAYLRRDFESAGRDLDATIGFLDVEAGRAVPELTNVFADNIGRLRQARINLGEPTASGTDLDNIFAQSHWVLSQHYFVEATQSRDAGRHRLAGRYLIATAHHLERSVMWSNLRIGDDILDALETLRDAASRLAAGTDPSQVYRERPLRLAAQTLVAVGEHIDRRVRIGSAIP